MIGIIGGAGAMGSWLAGFLKRDGFEVGIYDVDHERGKKIAERFGVIFWRDYEDLVEKSKVVIVSVPVGRTVDVIKDIAPLMSDGSLLMDVTSVKKRSIEAMERFSSPGVEIIGTHPMFAPRLRDISGQVVILTPVGNPSSLSKVETFLENKGAKVVIMTAEEHDRLMAIVQGLTHFSYIVTGSTIEELGINVKSTRTIVSPVYELMLDMIGRVVGQNPYLYADIQMYNEYVKEVRDVFIEKASELSDVISKGDASEFARIMGSSAKYIGDTEGSMKRTDKLIRSRQRGIWDLMGSIGTKKALRHLYSGVIHYGTIKKVTADEIWLDEGRGTRLNISNVEMLSDEEMRRWTMNNLPLLRRDISVVFPEHSDPEIIKKVIENSGNMRCKLVDIYEGQQIPEGKISYTFRLIAPRDVDLRGVERLLEGIGGKIR